MADNKNREIGGRVITAVTAKLMMACLTGLGEFKISGKGAGGGVRWVLGALRSHRHAAGIFLEEQGAAVM